MTKQTIFYDNGSKLELSSRSSELPEGYFLAQIGEYQQAKSGNPAVITLRDWADTVYSKQWQLFHYAHNFGMMKNNVMNPFGFEAALANKTGLYNPKSPKRNWVQLENLNKEDFWIDKLRTFSLNTHAVRDYDAQNYQVWTMDGSKDPIMKIDPTTGLRKPFPSSVEDIDSGKVKSTDYVHNPQETLYAFLVCNNFNTKTGGQTTISPFAGGLKYPWSPDPDEPFLFVPLVSRRQEPVLSLKSMWRKVSYYPSPYRRL